MIVERSCIAEILQNLSFFPVVGIIGPRQVGKTTLAKFVQSKIESKSLYLDLELDDDLYKLENAQSYLQMHSDKCIVIDEIQRMPTLFPLLRALIDQDRRPSRFILLGSASPSTIRNSSESLAGRIAYTELMPFSQVELSSLEVLQQEHWFRGGFPNSILAPSSSLSQTWLRNFIVTFLERDIRLLGYDISISTMERLLRMIAHLQSSTLNVSDLSRSLGISMPTVRKYMDLLEGAFILRRLEPYLNNIGKRLVKRPKVYIRDTGILHSISKIPTFESLLGNPIIGASWEGYVIEEIFRSLSPLGWEFNYYRTHSGAEIDLILTGPNGKTSAIEIKSTNNPKISKGYRQSVSDIKPDFKFIITPSSETFQTTDKITICSLGYFVKKELPMLAQE